MTERRWPRRAVLGLTLAGVVFMYLRPVLGHKRAPGPPAASSSALPERSLYRLRATFVSDAHARIELPALRGYFQVVALIFTRCPSVCPTLVHDMQALERAMPSAVLDATRFTLVSIDPAHDTPDALHAYRAKLGLSAERWTLLRGEPDSVRELSALLGFSYSSAGGLPLAHSKLVTVLNRDGEIIHQQASISADPGQLIEAIERAR